MSATWGDVRRWKAATLGEAVADLTRDLTALREARDLLVDAVPDSWRGRARDAAERRQRRLLADLDEQVRQRRTLRRAIVEAEGQVETLERGCSDAEARADRLGIRIGDDGSLRPSGAATTTDSDDPTVAELRDDVVRLLARAHRIDEQVADGVPREVVAFERDFGGPDPRVADRWRELTPERRRRAVRALVTELAREAGIPVPRVRFADPGGGYTGFWDEATQTLSLAPGSVDSVYVLNIVVHEMRHARQNEAIDDLAAGHGPGPDPFDRHERDGISERQTRRWSESFGTYVDLEEDPAAYRSQPVERDARRAGRDYLESLTVDRLERLLDAGR